MNQIIPTKWGLTIILSLSVGLGFYLWKLDQKVTAEINQSSEIYQTLINKNTSEILRNRK